MSDPGSTYRAALEPVLGPLRAAIDAAGFDVVRWDHASSTDLAEIADLAATRGIRRLVVSATHQVRQHNDVPPGSVTAWLPGWRDLRPLPAQSRTTLPGEDLPDASAGGGAGVLRLSDIGGARGLFDRARTAKDGVA